MVVHFRAQLEEYPTVAGGLRAREELNTGVASSQTNRQALKSPRVPGMIVIIIMQLVQMQR